MFFWKNTSRQLIGKIIVAGLVLSALTASPLFAFFFPAKALDGRNLLIKLLAYGVCTLANALLLLAFHAMAQSSGALQPAHRQTTALVFLVIGFVLLYLFNNVATTLDTHTRRWNPIKEPFEVMQVYGSDFRAGIYQPAKDIFVEQGYWRFITHPTAARIYSPLAAVLFSPLLLISEDQAYLVVAYASMLAVVAGLALLGCVLSRFTEQRSHALLITTLVVFYTLTSRYFMLMIERGNIDGIVFLLLAMFVYLLVFRPEAVWLQVIVISLAIHLKVYPALMLVFLIPHYGRKAIFPLLVVNLAFGLALGPMALLDYLRYLFWFSGHTEPWVGNHSAASFAWYVSDVYPIFKPHLAAIRWIALVFPVVIFLIGVLRAKHLIKNGLTWLMYLGLATYLMCFIPAISHDYKLILMSASLMVMVYLMYRRLSAGASFEAILEVAGCFLVLTVIHRSYKHLPEGIAVLGNHYLPMLAMLYYTVARLKIAVVPNQPAARDESAAVAV